MSETSVVEELSQTECWEELRVADVGRLAFAVVDEIHILPITFTIRGGHLYFLTEEGTKLLGVVMGSAVALEVDSHDDRLATSVVVRGTARLLPEDEAHLVDDLLTLPWDRPETPRYNVVQIEPTSLTGRRFARS
ncbi:pyridoxamine 5'-phosphate oxidase family protein [Nocardioides aurantiacus]|uniref:Nitroimidazol reductase NimA-like FMN-containing flavoprotein (Pyridoxamine 5'-phosphate oxidase superfamily) n=1 Tax=Nocardioides aurantiacus TaxID=86796 RepID=A0A3N2CTS6_9ACTN|nr:pyridoxamine 5'-phosphate oxidase family protein [Nocardioides aurantiacus]ROR90856.1 nitroimidazol reductase NimA-like FMN-containing flavoprotein (pyridoxamine 5'-phosphate oxidase superfamily) [Nocardioides aurantiacus]